MLAKDNRVLGQSHAAALDSSSLVNETGQFLIELVGAKTMALDAKQIRKPMRKVRRLFRNFSKQPTPNAVHDLRTNTRRIEATLSALSLDSPRNERRLRKALAQVRKGAGKVRDMDVLTAFAATVQPNGENDCKVQLLEHLGAKRSKGAKRLHAIVQRRGPAARKRLKRTERKIEQELCIDPDGSCSPDEARARTMASALRLDSELRSRKRLTRNNLHLYRLKVKELHNILRMAENSRHQEFVDALGKVKDAIGEWHDWEELLCIAREVLDHGGRCELLQELKRVSDEKYAHALKEAEHMRKKYLRIPERQGGRRAKQTAEPVWKASMAMAA